MARVLVHPSLDCPEAEGWSVIAGRTSLLVGFVVRWHKQVKQNIKLKQNQNKNNNNKNKRVNEKLLKILEFLSDRYIITIRTLMDRFGNHKVT